MPLPLNLSFTGGAATAQGGSAGESGAGGFVNNAPFNLGGSGGASQTSNPTSTSTPTGGTNTGVSAQTLLIVGGVLAALALVWYAAGPNK